MSGDLTKLINTVSQYPYVRAQVITTLAMINRRLEQLVTVARQRFFIKDDKPLVRFYMKGGNAFECVFNPDGPQATDEGGGNSDWDTQAIVDPWAPREVQAWLYGMIEDIVLDEMRRAGISIATIEKANTTEHFEALIPKSAKWPLADDVKLRIKKDVYTLTLDNPQTIRKIFDYDHLGLWFNDTAKLSDETLGKAASEMIPGIVLNDAIQPFKLYRLGYTWHAKATDPPPDPDVLDPPTAIEKLALMELIDVTLPRRNTIEAVAVWQELEEGILGITPVAVAVRPNPPASLQAVSLPMPGIFYHLVEISTMLCEIADGSSHHADKLPKRFDRFKKIMGMQGLDTTKALTMLSALVGVPDVTKTQADFNPNVTNAITTYARQYLIDNNPDLAELLKNVPTPTVQQVFGAVNLSTQLAWTMMNIVANRPPNQIVPSEVLKERAKFSDFLQLLGKSPASPYIVSAAYSDDLVLGQFLHASQYINIAKVKISGIPDCVIIRVTRYTDLNKMEQFITLVLQKMAESREAHLIVHSRQHNTVRPDGITSECTLVAFINGRPNSCITFTNATPEEAPFHLAPEDQRTTKDTMYCAPSELASQRKVAAALIADYSVRAAFANQYEILKDLLPGI